MDEKLKRKILSLGKSTNYDGHGIPIFSKEGVEKMAYEFLRSFDAECLRRPIPTPIGEILTALKNDVGLNIAFVELGHRGNKKILGRTVFSENRIYIDKNLYGENQGSFRFTAAHEIGHWIFHRHRKISGKVVVNNDLILEDDESDFLVSDAPSDPQKWMEFHANVFAESLLMPAATIQSALVDVQKRHGITRNLGTIYLDSLQQYSRQDADMIITDLAGTYITSKKAMEIRLDRMGLIKVPNAGG